MAKIKVTCPKCGHQFWMEDYESKACPNCGFVCIGPKANKPSSGCFITEACVEAAGLPDNCKELITLRSFRDEHLAKNEEGKKMLSEYYEVAPKIVEAIRREKDSNKIFHAIFSEIRKIVSLLEMGNMRGAIEYYKDMVLRLKKKYIENL